MAASRFTPSRLFGAFWTLGLALFTYTYFANPHDATLVGTDAYGHTYPGELRSVVIVTAAEVLVAAAILRPWSYRRSWGRALAAASVFAPWLLLWGALGLHAGPTTHLHSLWLSLFWFSVVTVAIVDGAAAVRARARTSSPAP